MFDSDGVTRRDIASMRPLLDLALILTAGARL